MSNSQPGDADGMIAAARDYAQHNRGGKYHAILWPFAALNSYNIAEGQYHGNRVPEYRVGSHLLKALNMEYARLQRLEHTLNCLTGKTDVDDAAQTVNCLYTLKSSVLCNSCLFYLLSGFIRQCNAVCLLIAGPACTACI